VDKRTATLLLLGAALGGGTVRLVGSEVSSLADEDAVLRGDTAVAHALDVRASTDGGVAVTAYGSARLYGADGGARVMDLGAVACEVPGAQQDRLYGLAQADALRDCARGLEDGGARLARRDTFVHAVDLRRSAREDGGLDYWLEAWATDARDGSTWPGRRCDSNLAVIGAVEMDGLALNCLRKGRGLGR
jgi:hypothetical protein